MSAVGSLCLGAMIVSESDLSRFLQQVGGSLLDRGGRGRDVHLADRVLGFAARRSCPVDRV